MIMRTTHHHDCPLYYVCHIGTITETTTVAIHMSAM